MKKFRCLILLGIILVSTAHVSFAQRTIRGIVYDFDNSTTLSGVEVSVRGTESSTQTDENGAYLLEVPQNTKTISFTNFPGMKVHRIDQVGQNHYDIYLSSEDTDLFELSLEELMNIEVTVASRRALRQREAPGILSVITRDEIQKSGARDLTDILRTIPGFNINLDVEATLGISVRGNWAHEGKILIMVDGQELNEGLYSTAIVGGRFSVDQIQRIEIIRGPGSSIYGGYAELGVINIITRSGNDLQGVEVSAHTGLMNGDLGTYYTNLNLGSTTGDWEFSVLGSFGQSLHTASEDFTDFYDQTVELNGTNAFNQSAWINTNVKYKDLSWRLIYDGYSVNAQTLFDEVTDEPYQVSFTGLYSELKYDWEIDENIILSPQYNFKQQTPWKSFDEVGDPLHVLVNKHTAGLHLSADILENLNVIAGTEFSQEAAEDRLWFDFFENDKIGYHNISFYTQAILLHNYFNLIMGGRYDQHEEFGGAFAPRLGLTKAFERFHYKALYSHAFRSPGIMNISLFDPSVSENTTIEPETTIVYELEMGYRFSSATMLTANVFDISIDSPIIYFYDEETESEGYFNADQSGTRGFEFNFRWQQGRSNLQAGYSMYFAAGKNKVEDYVVEGNTQALVGIPQQKLTINSSWQLIQDLYLNPQIIFLGSRFAYTEVDEMGNPILNEVDADMLINLNLMYRNAFTPGLDISLGVFDALDSRPRYYQPYNGYHAPYPGKHREIFLKVKYNFTY